MWKLQLQIAGSFLAACSLILSCKPQLGPKDSTNLPPNDVERVNVGDIAPDFTLEDVNGSRITLSRLRNQKLVLLIFYRGHW